MLPSANALPRRRSLSRHLLIGLIFAVGCSGSGSSCGSSCGGFLTTTSPDGGAFRFTGSKMDNTVQVRLTQDAFNQLNSGTFNQVIAGLNPTSNGSVFTLPCFATTVLSASTGCSPFDISQLNLVAGDSNFDSVCTGADGTPLYLKFNSVSWSLDPVNQVLNAKINVNIWSGDYYVRTAEAHSSIYTDDNGDPAPFQADIQIDDSQTLTHHTELDVSLAFTEAPDGRLLISATQSSLESTIANLDLAGMIFVSAQPGNPNHGTPNGNPAPPVSGDVGGFSTSGTEGAYNGCDVDATPTYLTMTNKSAFGLGTPRLTGSGWTVGVGATCTPDSTSESGIGCTIFRDVLSYLETFLQTTFETQIVNLLQTQLDNLRCQRGVTFDGGAIACTTNADCPNDDNGAATTCVVSRGVCVAQQQLAAAGDAGTVDGGPSALSAGGACEPVPLALQGTLDLSSLTQTVGFPANTKLNLYAGLGGKTAPAAVDDAGVQFAAVAGTQPASTVVPALCVPPTTFPPLSATIPVMNFDDPNNQPDGGVGVYDVGLSVASQLLNQASYDSFNAGVFCIQISNKTSSYVSTQLFKSFLPSLKLLTGGTDAPMAILIRPTLAPSIRIGRGTLTENDAGTDLVPLDPLVTLSLPQVDLDFYAVIDSRWVRLFTIQADINVPVGLRTFPGAQADTLQPVLGDLSNVITNISSQDNVMLAEDPSVVTDLLGAVVQFAQPLLAGLLQPIALPQLLGLQLQVQGIAGAVPVSSNIAQDGYAHLAIWAAISTCGGANQPACATRSAKTAARLVESDLPSSIEELRGSSRRVPAAIIEASASGVENAEYSYRIDGGLWSPWLHESRITIRNPMFFVQGHHRIEVTSREAGNDRTQDTSPAVVDFLSSYEAPAVELTQINDGRVVTHAKSQASVSDALKYSYKVGEGSWSAAGAARDFSAEELSGKALSVRVTDERGMSTESRFSNEELAAKQLTSAGCATAPGAASWSLLPLCCVGLVLALRRRRDARN